MSTRSFTTPGSHLWLLPANIDVNTPLTVTFKGAGGGGVGGGAGSLLVGTFDISALTPGVDVLEFLIGGKGGTRSGSTKGVGGTNGGGAGGNSSNGNSGSGGGGWTGLKIGAVLQAIAAGGGGAPALSEHDGGNGGTTTGQDGGGVVHVGGNTKGLGGTSSAGGTGGQSISPLTGDGQDGYALHGGHGNNGSYSGMYAGGGGGGGKFGGGGGGGSTGGTGPGGGGGGSDLTTELASVITHTRGGGAAARHNGSILVEFNAIPDGPAVSTGGNFDFNNDLGIVFAFSDPDVDDTLSAADVQWQIAGGGWTEIDGVILADLGLGRYRYDFPGGTVAIDGAIIEFQVRTYDQLSAQGDWSDSVFWTARDTPTSATITAPLAGDTIDSHDPVLSWNTVAGVFRSQLAVFDDTGTSQLLTYVVVLDDGVTTSFDTDMPERNGFVYVNATDLQLGVRWQQYDGVWSDWSLTGVVTVDINPPLTPTLVLTVDLTTASVLAEITNPGSDPFPPVHNDLYRIDVLTGDEVRIATGVPINGSFTDWMPGFRRDYSYIARAVTATGAFASST